MCLSRLIRSGRELFVRGPENLGIGTSALARVSTDPAPLPASFYSPRYMVKGALASSGPSHVKIGQRVVNNSINGNGSLLAGQMALQELADLTTGKASK